MLLSADRARLRCQRLRCRQQLEVLHGSLQVHPPRCRRRTWRRARAGYGVVSHARGQAPASAPSAFVAITPCRLLDTRVSQNVGTRDTPLDADETAIFDVWGTNGDCTIPSGATAIVGNLTVVKIHQTGAEFLTLFPASAARPKASTLNPDGVIAANGFTIALSDVGRLAVYNSNDQPDIIIDIYGYYVDTTVSPPTT